MGQGYHKNKDLARAIFMIYNKNYLFLSLLKRGHPVENKITEGAELRPNARSEQYNLTKKQTRFAELYIETNDPIHSLVEAGYAPVKTKDGRVDRTRTARRASTYLSNPKLRAYIEILREDVVEKVSWNAQKVLDKMFQTYMRATEAEDYTNANRSLENMGKHLGMFIDKKEIKQNTTTTFQGTDETFTPDVEEDIKRLANISGYSVIKGGKE
jgi:phage terminase small subunit